MNILKILLVLTSMLLNVSISYAESKNPTCIFMNFTDDTRYDEVKTADALSLQVFNELLNKGSLILTETNPIDENIEKLLYDEKVREYTILEGSMRNNQFNALFESAGFNENRAQSLATAQVGQFIPSEITSSIGREHGADYLIQGTIINLGIGNWWNEDYEEMSNAINMASSFTSMTSASDFSGIMSPLGFGNFDITKTGIGIQCDIRIIKAATGEVIWCKRVTGVATQKQLDTGIFKIGKGKLNTTLYSKAINKTAQKIVTILLEDMNNKKLFVK